MANTFCRVGICGLVGFPPLIEGFATKQLILHVNNILFSTHVSYQNRCAICGMYAVP